MSHKTNRKLFFSLTFFYITLLATLTVMNLSGADRYWFGALNLYLPQIIWGVPALFLVIYSLKTSWKWVWVPALCLLWVLGPIMGLCWSTQSIPIKSGLPSFRIMTCNAKFGKHDIGALIGEISRFRPDVVLLQDAGGSLESPLGKYLKNWNVRSFDQYVIASRFPLDNTEVRWISVPGEKMPCLRCRLQLGYSAITLYDVHFQTPREGLNAFRTARKDPWYLPEAIKRLKNNAGSRLKQAQEIRNLVIREKGPVIVGGDLNSPDTSLACITLRNAGLHDAFHEGGKGYGYSYGHFLLQHRLPWFKMSWMRIDHIMMTTQLRTRQCWTGTGKASDHRPVIADLVLGPP